MPSYDGADASPLLGVGGIVSARAPALHRDYFEFEWDVQTPLFSEYYSSLLEINSQNDAAAELEPNAESRADTEALSAVDYRTKAACAALDGLEPSVPDRSSPQRPGLPRMPLLSSLRFIDVRKAATSNAETDAQASGKMMPQYKPQKWTYKDMKKPPVCSAQPVAPFLLRLCCSAFIPCRCTCVDMARTQEGGRSRTSQGKTSASAAHASTAPALRRSRVCPDARTRGPGRQRLGGRRRACTPRAVFSTAHTRSAALDSLDCFPRAQAARSPLTEITEHGGPEQCLADISVTLSRIFRAHAATVAWCTPTLIRDRIASIHSIDRTVRTRLTVSLNVRQCTCPGESMGRIDFDGGLRCPDTPRRRILVTTTERRVAVAVMVPLVFVTTWVTNCERTAGGHDADRPISEVGIGTWVSNRQHFSSLFRPSVCIFQYGKSRSYCGTRHQFFRLWVPN